MSHRLLATPPLHLSLQATPPRLAIGHRRSRIRSAVPLLRIPGCGLWLRLLTRVKGFLLDFLKDFLKDFLLDFLLDFILKHSCGVSHLETQGRSLDRWQSEDQDHTYGLRFLQELQACRTPSCVLPRARCLFLGSRFQRESLFPSADRFLRTSPGSDLCLDPALTLT